VAIMVAYPPVSVFAQVAANPAVSVASPPSSGLAMRYPPGSIRSTEAADRALSETASERAANDAQFAVEKRACYSKFFANACIDAARERHRVEAEKIRKVEVEANSFKRHAQVNERDKALAEHNKKVEADEAERQKRLQESQSASAGNPQAKAQGGAPAQSVPKQSAPSNSRVAEHEARLRRIEEKERADAQKRAENVAAYERKVKEAQERQQKVEERKKEKQQKQQMQLEKGAPGK
jgi:hypothetical protein